MSLFVSSGCMQMAGARVVWARPVRRVPDGQRIGASKGEGPRRRPPVWMRSGRIPASCVDARSTLGIIAMTVRAVGSAGLRHAYRGMFRREARGVVPKPALR